MGQVYLARDLRHDQQRVALKLHTNADDNALVRFSREATVLAALHHPAIVR
jgi:serine/threonine protein kinase